MPEPDNAPDAPQPPAETFELDAAEGELPEGEPRPGWIGPLFLVPLGLVAAALALYLFMTWMVGDKEGPEEHLSKLLSGGTNARKQGYFQLGLTLIEYRRDGRLGELPDDFDDKLAAAFDGSDPDEAMIRIATAQALGLMDSPLAFERVVAMVREAEGSLGVVEPQNPLESLGVVETGHLNPLTKGLELLGQLGDPRAVPVLADFIGHEDPGIRQISAAALGGIAAPTVIEPLTGALSDEDRDTRYNAAVSLAKRGSNAGLEVLVQMLSPDNYEGYRASEYRDQAILYALRALEELRADSAKPQVEALIEWMEEAVGERKGSLRVVGEGRRWLERQSAGWPAL